jgi:hypothetical protein
MVLCSVFYVCVCDYRYAQIKSNQIEWNQIKSNRIKYIRSNIYDPIKYKSNRKKYKNNIPCFNAHFNTYSK